MTLRCGYGRGRMSPEPAQCSERPLPDGTYCHLHKAEAMARVLNDTPPNKRGDKPRRWTGGYMVSGSSRE